MNQAERKAGKRKTILVVEDDPSIRGGLVRAIQEDDIYNVVPIENGLLAIEWLGNNEHPHLIITDYMMLGDGAQMVSLAYRLKIPIVMVTAAPEEAQKAIEAQGVKIPIFPKPFDVFDVLKVVDALADVNKLAFLKKTS